MHSGKVFMSDQQLYLLGFYVPEDDLEKVLQAVFSAGAGKFRNYDRCAWTTAGEGRFRGLENSKPVLGKAGEEMHVHEIKAECIVPGRDLEKVRNALLEAHPYEEPAYHFIAIDGV